ncbi:hypothetical protein DSOL_0534 [Desulfosporosinus metallidurans]|uniref:Uncharacterized protein n=1 Tax=Desulfosporosinus metallidurans TaxID=1888891 RepID=A0A1Q8R137_9FIRM|nr:hypothetical protein DSOL_0534 [Desulfosporosinus metallidurans]
MRTEHTKWGSRLITEKGYYIGFAWKAYLLAIGSAIVVFSFIAFLNK